MLDTLLAVPGGFKTRPYRPDSSILRFCVFQIVTLGYCQTTVRSGAPYSLSEAPATLWSGLYPVVRKFMLKLLDMIQVGC